MKCPNCGKEIANDSKFCEFCGAKIIFASISEKSPQKKKVVWITLILILCLLLLGGILYYEHEQIEVAQLEARIAQTRADEEANMRREIEEEVKREKERQKRAELKRKDGLKAQGWVDLGLPSGTLWKDKNEAGGFYSYDNAMAMFGNSLPNKEQWEELKSSCSWVWSGRGYTVTGPSGESIALPAAGFCYLEHGGGVADVGSEGYYWSSTPYDSKFAWRIFFCSSRVTMYYFEHSGGMSVRLVYK